MTSDHQRSKSLHSAAGRASRDSKQLCWKCRDRVLLIAGRPLIMGILNVTPDSFSDGGRFVEIKAAVAHGLRLAEEGADIIDVGGESTRPGAADVEEEEELRRTAPVIAELARNTDAVISIDTRKSVVARRAIEAGAHIVNDVSALTHDPKMPTVIRECGAGAILTHISGAPRTMQNDPHYDDVVAEVSDYLRRRVRSLTEGGLNREALAVDPGIGFGKTLRHNVRLLADLGAIGNIGRPVVIGLSRKSFLGMITGRPVGERLAGSLAGLVFCALNGAHVLRVHDVKESRDAALVAAALGGNEYVE